MGHELAPGMAAYLNANGVTSNDLSFFRERRAVGQRWLGWTITRRASTVCARQGARTTSRRADRLPRAGDAVLPPVRHSALSLRDQSRAPPRRGLARRAMARHRAVYAAGVPIRGFTWYSLTDQVDWQYALREERNHLHPVGLYDLNDGRVRLRTAIARSSRHGAARWLRRPPISAVQSILCVLRHSVYLTSTKAASASPWISNWEPTIGVACFRSRLLCIGDRRAFS